MGSGHFDDGIYEQTTCHTCPPMGSGHFDDGIHEWTCFMNQLQYLDSNYDLHSPTNVQTFMSSCYFEEGNSYKNDSQGYSFCFGGPLAPKMIVTTFFFFFLS